MTPLTHIAQAAGLSFRVYASAACIAAIGASTGVLLWELRGGGPALRSGRRALGLLLVACLASACFPVVALHATGDDTMYLPPVSRALAVPDAPMDFAVRALWLPGPPPVSPHWNAATPFEWLQGVVAWVTGIPLLAVRFQLGPLLVAALLPPAWLYLLERLRVGTWEALAGWFLAAAALLLARETGRAPGCMAFFRFGLAKFAALSVGFPLFAALAVDFLRGPCGAAWLRLLILATALAGCGTSTTVLLGLLAPVLALAGGAAFAPSIGSGLRRGAGLMAALAYPALCAAWAWTASGRDFGTQSPVNLPFPRDFAGQASIVVRGPATAAVLLAAALAVARGLPRPERLFLAVWTAAMAVLYLNPLVARFVMDHLTSPNLYWRLLYALPLFPAVAVAGSRAAAALGVPGHPRAALRVAAAVSVLLALQVPASMSGLYRRSEFLRAFPDPARCLRENTVDQARFLRDAAPPGAMLAPAWLSQVVPVLDEAHPQVVHQEESLRLWCMGRCPPGEAEERIEAGRFLEGNAPAGADAVQSLVRRYIEIRSVVAFPGADRGEGLTAMLAKEGFGRIPVPRRDLLLFVRRGTAR